MAQDIASGKTCATGQLAAGHEAAIRDIREKAVQLADAKKYEAAAHEYRRLLELQPDNIHTHLTLSAILRAGGEIEAAADALRCGLAAKPHISWDFDGTPRATILEIAGLQNCRLILKKGCRFQIEGGHFTTKHLIDRQLFARSVFYLRDENLIGGSSLPYFDIIVNTIADPDKEPEGLATLSKFLKAHPQIPVINHPDKVMVTTRDRNYVRLRDLEGVIFPKTLQICTAGRDPDEIGHALSDAGFDYPILLREPGWHTGQTFAKVGDDQGLRKYLARMMGDRLYVTEFVDTATKGLTALTSFFKYYRKMRVFFIDGEPFPVVCHTDNHWNVHGSNRRKLMVRHRWMREEEFIFVSDYKAYLGADAAATLERINQATQLDFFGIDFNVLPDGRVLVFETNPAMRHSFDHVKYFEYLTPHLEAITRAFNAMLLRRLETA